MNVKELIEELQKYDQELEVELIFHDTLDGYKGFRDIDINSFERILNLIGK